MKKIFIYFAIITFAFTQKSQASEDWGATGHRVIGEIADNYLCGKAKRNIKKLLKKKSLAFVSTFGDEIKSDKRYREFYTWHYMAILA